MHEASLAFSEKVCKSLWAESASKRLVFLEEGMCHPWDVVPYPTAAREQGQGWVLGTYSTGEASRVTGGLTS